MTLPSNIAEICGNPATSIDHTIPRCKGGSNDFDNLNSACGSCNSSKGGKWRTYLVELKLQFAAVSEAACVNPSLSYALMLRPFAEFQQDLTRFFISRWPTRSDVVNCPQTTLLGLSGSRRNI